MSDCSGEVTPGNKAPPKITADVTPKEVKPVNPIPGKMLSLLDGTLVATIAIAVLYLLGTSYYSGFFAVFGMTYSDVGIGSHEILYANFSLLRPLIAVCFGFALVVAVAEQYGKRWLTIVFVVYAVILSALMIFDKTKTNWYVLLSPVCGLVLIWLVFDEDSNLKKGFVARCNFIIMVSSFVGLLMDYARVSGDSAGNKAAASEFPKLRVLAAPGLSEGVLGKDYVLIRKDSQAYYVIEKGAPATLFIFHASEAMVVQVQKPPVAEPAKK